MNGDENGKPDEAGSPTSVLGVRPVEDERTPLEKLRDSVIEVVEPFTPAVEDDDWDALS